MWVGTQVLKYIFKIVEYFVILTKSSHYYYSLSAIHYNGNSSSSVSLFLSIKGGGSPFLLSRSALYNSLGPPVVLDSGNVPRPIFLLSLQLHQSFWFFYRVQYLMWSRRVNTSIADLWFSMFILMPKFSKLIDLGKYSNRFVKSFGEITFYFKFIVALLQVYICRGILLYGIYYSRISGDLFYCRTVTLIFVGDL